MPLIIDMGAHEANRFAMQGYVDELNRTEFIRRYNRIIELEAELAKTQCALRLACSEIADRCGYCPADGVGDFTGCTCDGRKSCTVDQQVADCWYAHFTAKATGAEARTGIANTGREAR